MSSCSGYSAGSVRSRREAGNPGWWVIGEGAGCFCCCRENEKRGVDEASNLVHAP
jgi:hypothetical protein